VTTAVASEKGLSLRALALGMADGETLWDQEIFARPEVGEFHKKNSHASPTPIMEDGKLYAHFGHQGTACLNAVDGKVLWKQESLEYPPLHGNGGSPILFEDKLIFSCDGTKDPFIVALNKSTGEIVWKTNRGVEVSRTFSFSTPLAIEVDGRWQIVSPASGAVIAYDPSNGKEIWRCLYGEGYSVVPRPLFAHGLVYVCSGFDSAKLLAIDPAGKGDVTKTHLKWTIDKRIPKESSPIIVGEQLYANDDKGIVSCFDAKSGKQVWQKRIDGGGGYSGSPVYAAGHLFFHNGDGITTVIKPGETFKQVAENKIGEFGLSSFAVVDDGFVIRTESSLLRLRKP
jgi:outer membrane protein assembly factor BamB